MDTGATLFYLLTIPVVSKDEYFQQMNRFRGLLISSNNDDLRLILKQLKYLSSESVLAQSVQSKYKYYIKRRLAGFDDESCPEVRESLFPVLKDRSGQLYHENPLLFKVLDLVEDYNRLFPVKISLIMRKASFFKQDKKLLKFIKSKVRIYRFCFKVFQEHRELVHRCRSYFESLLVSSLKKHAKTYRRNNKVQNFFDLFISRIKSAFIVLNVKLPTSAPMTPRKSPKKRDFYLNMLINLSDDLVASEIQKRVKNLKETFPPLKKKFKLNKFYNNFIDYYKKFMYIKFFNKVEKNIKGKRLLDLLFTSILVKHSENYSKFYKSHLALKRLVARKFKLIYRKLEKANKLFITIKNNCHRAAKIIDKVLIKKLGKKFYGWGRIISGLNRMKQFCMKKVKKVMIRVRVALIRIEDSEEKLRNLMTDLQSFEIYTMKNFSRKYNKFKRLKNLLLSAYSPAVKKTVFQLIKYLKELKQEISTINCKNHLKFFRKSSIFLKKSEESLKSETIEKNRMKNLNQALRKVSLFFKKRSWKKVKTCEKFYMFDFCETKILGDFTVSTNPQLLRNQEKNHLKSASENFLQLYSLINSSLTTQRLAYNKIDENCSDLSQNLSSTKESLSNLDDLIIEYNSKISSINENKSKVFQSNQMLEDLLSKSLILDEDNKKLSTTIQQNIELDKSLEYEVHTITKSTAELANSCNESELEISHIEFEYSHVLRERDSFRNSPERHTRLGLSPSPGRRSPVKSKGSPLRDSFRSPVRSFVARSPISPDRSRVRTRNYE